MAMTNKLMTLMPLMYPPTLSYNAEKCKIKIKRFSLFFFYVHL